MSATAEITPRGGEAAWAEVLTAAARATEASRGTYDDSKRTRDRRISEAIGAGIPRSRVAQWAGVSRVRVTQICADPLDDEELDVDED